MLTDVEERRADLVCKLRSSQCRLWSQCYGAKFRVMEVDANCDGNYKAICSSPCLHFVKYVIESEEESLMMRVTVGMLLTDVEERRAEGIAKFPMPLFTLPLAFTLVLSCEVIMVPPLARCSPLATSRPVVISTSCHFFPRSIHHQVFRRRQLVSVNLKFITNRIRSKKSLLTTSVSINAPERAFTCCIEREGLRKHSKDVIRESHLRNRQQKK